jgi:CDP-glucose 4,6-dehydratase
VIGGGDYAKERLLPDLIRSLKNQSEITLRNPSSTRPWQHVLDPLLGYVMTAQKILNGDEIISLNFAPDGASLTVKQVADIASSEWGGNHEFKFENEAENVEARTLQLDATRAKSLLGWNPRWTQEEAVRSTVKWWKTVLSEQISAIDACKFDLNQVFSNER